jgi:hypothetical protein
MTLTAPLLAYADPVAASSELSSRPPRASVIAAVTALAPAARGAPPTSSPRSCFRRGDHSSQVPYERFPPGSSSPPWANDGPLAHGGSRRSCSAS